MELGQESYAYKGTTDGHNGVSCMVFQTAGSNATEVNNNIDKFLEEARKDLPKGVELTQLMSSNDFLYASIHEVVKTLIEVLAGYPFYTYSVGRNRCIAYRYVCFHGIGRFQYQPDNLVCSCFGDRYGGG